MPSRREFISSAAVLALLNIPYARAQPIPNREVRIGMVSEMSGPYAEFGYQFSTAIRAFMKRHGNTIDGIKISVLTRDVAGPNPDLAKRLAQELIVRDKVDVLGGFGFSPNALSVAQVSAQAHIPMVVMNASALDIPKRSKYIVRTSTTAIESAHVIGRWAAAQKVKTAASLVMDYSAGIDAEHAFIKAYEKGGGKMIGTPIRVPLSSLDYDTYVQKVKDLQPEALFAFTSGGSAGVAFLKAVRNRGIQESGIKLIATGDITIEPVLEAAGDVALGAITAYPYSPVHPSAENKQFVADFLAAGDGKTVPSLLGVSAWDGIAAIYQVIRKLKGSIDGDKAMKIFEGMHIESPRGPLTIDATTRNPVQNIYIRKVERRNQQLANYEFETIDAQNV